MSLSRKISKNFEVINRSFGKGTFPHQMSWFLDLPGRQFILSAEQLSQRLPLKPDGQALEIGPGSGFYSVDVARRIPNGQLTLLDVQKEMLNKCEKKLTHAGLSNFEAILSEEKCLPFEDNKFDVVYMVAVLGEIPDQTFFLSEISRVLKNEGVISITEHHPDPDFETSKNVKHKLVQNGFTPLQTLGWSWVYTINASNNKN